MILHTERQGSGEPLLFLHSSLKTGAIDFTYQRNYFMKHYRVIAADLRGHGKSKAEYFTNYLTDAVQDIEDTLDALRIDAVHIVGCSLGALIGFLAAKQFPNRVISLTISGVLPTKPKNWQTLLAEDREKQIALFADEQIAAYFDDLHDSDWRQILGMSQQEGWYPFTKTRDVANLTV